MLDRLAAVVQFFDFGDYRSGVHSFFARRRMAASRSSLSCLIVSMVLKYYVFGEQNYKTNPNRKHICRLFLLLPEIRHASTRPGGTGCRFGFFLRHIFRQSTVKSIELLAPAKDLQAAVAAVDYGADALYIGGARFGARHAAGNSAEEIARAVEYAHQYGVRVHATLNTLLYDGELAEAERQARELIAAGVDALIVQDMALRRMNLPVELHASTQAATRTPEQALFWSAAALPA